MRVMREHIGVARRFPGIETNTAYSFGLDDQEFVVAFDADDPAEFLDLVQELRATESSTYTSRDPDLHVHLGVAGPGSGRSGRRSGPSAGLAHPVAGRVQQLLGTRQLHARAPVGLARHCSARSIASQPS